MKHLLSSLLLLLCLSVKSQNDYGAKFTCLGPLELPTQNIGFMNAVEVMNGRYDTIYAGSLYGGLWRGTRVRGQMKRSWVNVTDSYKKPGTGINALEIVPKSSGPTIYIATQMGGNGRLFNYSNGILKSDNGGKSWTEVGPQFKIEEKKETDFLKMCPFDSELMIARIGKELYLTEDGWKNWKKLSYPFKNTDARMYIADVEWKPFDRNTFYITSRSESNIKSEFFKTADLGKTWTDMLHGLVAGNIQMDVINRKGYEELLYIFHGV